MLYVIEKLAYQPLGIRYFAAVQLVSFHRTDLADSDFLANRVAVSTDTISWTNVLIFRQNTL